MRVLLACVFLLRAHAVLAAPEDQLRQRLVELGNRGEAVVVQAHVALCDNRILRCGGHGLGDGDNPRTNLYWGTTEGLGGWLRRSGGAWTRVAERPGEGDRLLVSVWRRRVEPQGRMKAQGLSRAFDAYLVIDVWRGTAIDRGVSRFVEDLQGDAGRRIEVDGLALSAGGAAPIVAYVGHNRWMDDLHVGFARALRRTGAKKGVVAIACYSSPYLRPRLDRDGHLALVLTRDFVMASGAALVGGLDAFLDGGDLGAVRRGAANEYARAGRKDPTRVAGAFVNPAAKGW